MRYFFWGVDKMMGVHKVPATGICKHFMISACHHTLEPLHTARSVDREKTNEVSMQHLVRVS